MSWYLRGKLRIILLNASNVFLPLSAPPVPAWLWFFCPFSASGILSGILSVSPDQRSGRDHFSLFFDGPFFCPFFLFQIWIIKPRWKINFIFFFLYFSSKSRSKWNLTPPFIRIFIIYFLLFPQFSHNFNRNQTWNQTFFEIN